MAPLEPLPIDGAWRPESYVPTPMIVRLEGYPRFGRPKEFVDLMGDDSELRNEYLWGVAINSIITLLIFVVWALILLILKCCGKRVGCASGVPRKPQRPAPMASSLKGSAFESEKAAPEEAVEDYSVPELTEEEYQGAMAKYREDVKGLERRMMVTRVLFLVSGLVVIVASILFFVMGVGSLIDSLKNVQSVLTYAADDVLQSGINVTNWYIDSFSVVSDLRDQMNNVDDFCPNLTDVNIPQIPEGSLLDSETVMAVKDALVTIFTEVAKLTDSFESTAEYLRDDLTEIQTVANDINSSLNQAYPYLYATLAISVILNIIVICLMVSVALAWAKKKLHNCFVKCMSNVVILPLFFFFLILAWLFATLFQFVAIAGADFCIAPNENTAFILEEIQKRFTSDSIMFELMKFYVLECNSELIPLPDDIVTEATIVKAVVQAVHDFLELVASDEAMFVLVQMCGDEGNIILQDLVGLIHARLHVVYGLLVQILNLLQCKKMNPLYTMAANYGMCTNGVGGLAWIFTSLLAIAIASMCMITFRAAAHQIEDDDEDKVITHVYLTPHNEEESQEEGGNAPKEPDEGSA